MEEPFQGKMAGRRIARKEPRVHCGGPRYTLRRRFLREEEK